MSCVNNTQGEPHMGKAMWNSRKSKLRRLPISLEVQCKGWCLCVRAKRHFQSSIFSLLFTFADKKLRGHGT